MHYEVFFFFSPTLLINKVWLAFNLFFAGNAAFRKHEKYCNFHSMRAHSMLAKNQYCHLVGVRIVTCHPPPSRLLLSVCFLGVVTYVSF